LLLADPYPLYAALRADAPVHFSERYGFWAVTRYDDVRAAQRDWETFSTAEGVDIDGTGAQYGSGDFLEEDPPRHDVLRAVVREHFVPKRLRAELTEPVRAEVRRLLGELREMGSVDLARQLAWPLPVAVGSFLLGIPSADRDLLLGLQRRLAERTPGTREMPGDARDAAVALRSYFADLIESRRSRPEADIVTAIATAEPDGRPIGDDAVGMLFLLFVASMETTASSIGNALFLLGNHGDQRRQLAANPGATEQAVEEVLRFEAPVQVTKRVTTREIRIHDADIPCGAEVFLVLASANRDERRYDRGDEFDIGREPLRHLAFGDGIHHCLGAPLARLELRIVLEELLQMGLSYELDGRPKRLNSHFIRGFSELPARVS
jgi:cytochrome P450